MNVLDTDLLVAILRGNDEVKPMVDNLNSKEIAITSISAFELYRGAFASRRSTENAKAVAAMLSAYDILPFDHDAAKITGKLYVTLVAKGVQIEIRDAMIAGTCLSNNASIVTRNVRHYDRVSGLKVEPW
ncbi:MAG: hypothetical protein MSIBF_04540 [Candidatus Altiarchaeales archaeon IMC4]|nr:MAG: hypothetical protein MSIBF_04540 [Candidatus Altiarchaeales archaeon IMC4]